MEEVKFKAVLAHIADRCLSEEDIENLQQKEILSEEQVLWLVDGLLDDIETNSYDSALVKKILDIGAITKRAIEQNNASGPKPYSEKTLTILQTLTEANFPKYRSHLTVGQVLFFFINIIFLAIPVLIMSRTGNRFDRKIADAYPFGSLPAALEDVSSQFNEAVKDSVVEACLIGRSIGRNINASIQKYKLSTLIDIIETMKSLEKEPSNPGMMAWLKPVELDDEKISFLQKVIHQLEACETSPSISEIMAVKRQFEDHLKSLTVGNMPDYEKKVKGVLNYLEGLEALALYTNGINYAYSGIQQKHKRLLESNSLGEEEKEFIEQLSNDLAEYVTYPVGTKLKTIKEHINAELDKENLSEVYKNDLNGVLYWFELQQLRFKERFTEDADIYSKLQQHGELMLPLDQGFDLYVGDGMCAGYQQAWSARVLSGGGEKPIFGIKPNAEKPPFALVPYDNLDPRNAKLNHLFPVSIEITDLQEMQGFSKLFFPKKIKEQIAGEETFRPFIDWVIGQVNRASGDDQKVFYMAFSTVNDQGASEGYHALGLWRTNTGVYHFFDANYGWFRCKDEGEFRLWFQDYLSASKLKYGECVSFDQLFSSDYSFQRAPYANPSAVNSATKHETEEVLNPKNGSANYTTSRLLQALALETSNVLKPKSVKKTAEENSFAHMFHQPVNQARKTVESPVVIQDPTGVSKSNQ